MQSETRAAIVGAIVGAVTTALSGVVLTWTGALARVLVTESITSSVVNALSMSLLNNAEFIDKVKGQSGMNGKDGWPSFHAVVHLDVTPVGVTVTRSWSSSGKAPTAGAKNGDGSFEVDFHADVQGRFFFATLGSEVNNGQQQAACAFDVCPGSTSTMVKVRPLPPGNNPDFYLVVL